MHGRKPTRKTVVSPFVDEPGAKTWSVAKPNLALSLEDVHTRPWCCHSFVPTSYTKGDVAAR
eukprot:4358086-Lingulodinium_polyedra.AAC.1